MSVTDFFFNALYSLDYSYSCQGNLMVVASGEGYRVRRPALC